MFSNNKKFHDFMWITISRKITERILVTNNNIKVPLIRNKTSDMVWEGEVLNFFVVKIFLYKMPEYSGARDDPTCDRNSISLETAAGPIRFCVYSIKIKVEVHF